MGAPRGGGGGVRGPAAPRRVLAVCERPRQGEARLIIPSPRRRSAVEGLHQTQLRSAPSSPPTQLSF